MALPPEVEASYATIIDSILAASDLNTISEKRIRQGLQQVVEYDITPQKTAIKQLIMIRFNKFVPEKNTNALPQAGPPRAAPPQTAPSQTAPSQNTSPQANGNTVKDRDLSMESKQENSPSPAAPRRKRREDEDTMSDIKDTPPPPKKRKKATAAEDEDAAFAAKLQAEENILARPTRGGANRKAPVVKKKKKQKVKRTDKVTVEDDSNVEGSGSEEKKVNRSGGFHKPLTLSAPLSALLDGETQLSRPQTVKRIWEYVKERGLQDPKDRRKIRCDDAMRAVFKQDKVDMFNMNKILNQNLYRPEE